MDDFSVEDTLEPEFTVEGSNDRVIPQGPALQQRAEKAHYSMGAESPGVPALVNSIASGEEDMLRRSLADAEAVRFHERKRRVVSEIAKTRGQALTPAETEIVMGLSQAEFQSDPATVLERKFAEKYTQDVLVHNATMMATDWNAETAQEVEVGTKVIGNIEYFRNKLHDLEAEAAQQGWIGYTADMIAQLIPFLPWWRQKQALEQRPGVEFLMGTTMAENVAYMWALPEAERNRQYEAAMAYLKPRNMQDALAFARGMVAFPTSDQYIANTISMADYSTIGSFAGKLIPRGGKAVKGATEVLPPWYTPKLEEVIAKNPEQVVYKQPEQLDLFGAQPAQGEFRFMSTPDGGQPPWVAPPAPKPEIEDIVTAVGTYRGPGGRMQRARPRSVEFRDEDGVYSIVKMNEPVEVNPNTGIYRGRGGRFQKSTEAMRQIDLPLGGEAPGQTRQHAFEFPMPTPATKEVRQVMADAVKAMEDPNPTVEKVLAATGRTGDAAVIKAATEVTTPKPINTLQDLAETLPSFGGGAAGFYQGARYLHRELASRLINAAQTRGTKWLEVLTNAARGAYITPEALAVGQREAEKFLREYYNRFADSVVNVRQTPADLHPMHMDTVTLQLGKPEGKIFATADEAKLYKDEIYGLGDEAVIRKIGNEWFLEIDRHVDITSDAVKAANITPKNSLNTNWFKMLANRLLGADTLLPEFQQQQRKIAQHAQQQVKHEIASRLEAAYQKLTKAESQRLQQILAHNRDTVRPGRPDKRGMWYNTAQEFEAEYVAKFGVTPRGEVTDAYYAYRQASDMDWMMANIAAYRDKAVLGVEQHQFSYGGKKSGWFEAKLHNEMPWSIGRSDQDAGVWVYDSRTGAGKFYYKFDMTDAQRKEIDNLIETQGYKVAQIFEAHKHPLKGIAKTALGEDLKEQVHFVITNTFERKPLSFKQVEYEPGGHVIYKHDWYVSAVNLQEGRGGKWTYLGDTPFLNVRTQAEAKKWAERINVGMAYLRTGRIDELEVFLRKNLPYSLDEFMGMFNGPKAFLNMNVPVEFKQAGRRTIDTVSDLKARYENGNLIDGTRNPHDLSSLMDKSFLMERDHQLYTVLDGPKPRLTPAESLDPYTTMVRAFAQRFHNVWMNDYKIAAVQQWVQEAVNAGVMKAGEKTLSANPMYFLYHPQYNPNVANRELKAAVEAERQHVVNFLGQQTELGKNLSWLQTKIQDSVYNYLGQGKVLDSTIAATADPVGWLRATAFHTKLGFFNPAQFFVQSQAMSHVLAVAGVKNGMPGVAGGTLARYLANGQQHLDTVAKIAGKFGWKEADFKEMVQLLDKSGLYQVAGEAALRNDNFDMNLFRSKLGHVLFDIGPVFFNEGERIVRLSAFATAYREFKLANKTARIGDRELSEIMNRSDLLSVNMTRASNAAWQSGAMSVPTQFFAFQARMMEQFLGKRLTAGEKLRAFATYSALYGVPIGLGTATGIGSVWPVYDSFREEAIKRGVEFNSTHEKILTDGLLQYATFLATGKEFNVAQRLGPGNNQMIRDMLSGDKALMEIVMGASGSILGDIISTSWPLIAAAGSMFNGEDSYPMTSEDFFRVARNISSMDMVLKQYHALQYGKWITKNGVVVGPANSVDALMAVLGLTSKENADAFLGIRAIKSWDKAQDWYEKDAMNNFRTAMQSLERGDTKSFDTFMARANQSITWGDFDPKKSRQIFERAVEQNMDLVDKIKWDLVRKAPNAQYGRQLENYIRNK